ncbi:MAG: aconitase family protein, partial [Acidobacteriota bacterium]
MATRPSVPTTLFEKIWTAHKVLQRPDGQSLLYVDRHLIHDGYQPAFEFLAARNLRTRRPDLTFGTPDHYIPTSSGRSLVTITDPERRGMVDSLTDNARASGITVFDLNDRRQGIVHIIGPEQGISQPG